MSTADEFDGEVVGRVEALPGRASAARVRWKNGVFTSVEPLDNCGNSVSDWILPAFFDPQVNGFAGVDFQQDDLSAEQLLHAVRELRRHACSRILLTLITDEWPKLMKRLARVKALRDANPELRHAIAGWHIEGPFLSEKPGYCGAHAPELMIDATENHIRELREITAGDPVMLTMAPERPGAIAQIEFAAKQGIVVSAGHTNASTEDLAAAVKAGAKGFTHLGNGCPRTLDRQDNILWRALNQSGLTYGLIPDAIHVSPELFRIMHYAAAGFAADALHDSHYVVPQPFYYTTDAMAAAGAPPGQYRIGRLNLEVGADRVVRLPGQSLFAGSALTPLEGFQRAIQMRPRASVIQHFAASALHMMNLPEPFAFGQSADFCCVKRDSKGQIVSGKIYVRGEPTPLSITH